MKFFSICFFLYMITSTFCQKNPNFAENRSTIVHLFEWKWKDIAQECENFLSKHGYGGVQIHIQHKKLLCFVYVLYAQNIWDKSHNVLNENEPSLVLWDFIFTGNAHPNQVIKLHKESLNADKLEFSEETYVKNLHIFYITADYTCFKLIGYRQNGVVQENISPPNENLIIKGRPWYERYQPVSYRLKTRSGDEEDFKNMTKRCNNVGIRIYVDAVLNHMSAGSGIGTAGNRADASKNNFPGVPFRSEHFHKPCGVNNYNDANEVRGCELVGLKDLDQGQDYVREKIVEFLNHLIDLGVAGFRIDAAKHMHPNDLRVIFSRLKNLNTEYDFSSGSRPFIYQEIPGLGGEAVNRDDYTNLGCVLEFKYGHHLSRVFRKNDKPRYLDSWGPRWGLLNSGYDAVTFIDNHDTQRYESDKLTYKHSKQYKMAVAFMLSHPYGTGRIMSSYAFTNRETSPPHDSNDDLLSPGFRSDNTCTNGFICEHRWRQIYNMVKFRNVVTGTGIDSWQTLHDHQIAFCRGRRGFIVFNNEGNVDREVEVCLPEGDYCDIISGDLVNGKCTGKTVKVNSKRKAHILLHGNDEDGLLAIHLESRLKN